MFTYIHGVSNAVNNTATKGKTMYFSETNKIETIGDFNVVTSWGIEEVSVLRKGDVYIATMITGPRHFTVVNQADGDTIANAMLAVVTKAEGTN
jgi:hypothetical protein